MRSTGRDTAALDLVLELVVLLNEDMTRALARDGLTPSRARVLWQLQARGPCTQKVLADALEVSPRNITGLVDALAGGGFVTREPHPNDRRATLVSFTTHGVRTATHLAEGRRQLAELLFARMPDGQFDGLVDGLGALLARLRAELAAQTAGPAAASPTKGGRR
jgi:DNA-binding MarR family transcriptional regulator